MKILLISESPLEKDDRGYHAVDPWIQFPIQLAEYCDQLTLWAPVKILKKGEVPSQDSWPLPASKMKIAEQDYYYSFATYYRLLLTRSCHFHKQLKALIQSHNLILLRHPSPMVCKVASLSKKMKKPYVALLAGDVATQSDKVIHSKGIKKLVYKSIVKLVVAQEKKAAKTAARIYAYSQELANRHPNEKNKIRFMRTPHLTERDFTYRDDTCAHSPIRLLRVAWLIPSKGLESLLNSIQILLSRGYNIQLDLVGKERESGYEKHLRDYARKLGIEEHIRFLGWIPYTQLPEIYLKNDIQVISSLSEGTPRCMVEGFARGLPLVATAVGGCKDALSNGHNALLVPPQDPDSMAGAMEQIIQNKTLRQTLIKNGYQSALEVTFETLGKRITEELRELIPSQDHGTS